MKTGVCKECFEDVDFNTQELPYAKGIYECPNCDYPNDYYDFWEVFEK